MTNKITISTDAESAPTGGEMIASAHHRQQATICAESADILLQGLMDLHRHRPLSVVDEIMPEIKLVLDLITRMEAIAAATE